MLRRLLDYATNNPLVSGLLVLVISGSGSALWLAVKDPASKWFWTDAHVSWGGITLIVLVMLAALTAIIGLISALRRARNQARAAVTPQAAAAAPQAPVRFAPESFELTGPRARALLALLEHVDSRISLHTVHQAVQRYQRYVDVNTIKARVQRDMEEAAHAGIVRIDTVGDDTRIYSLSKDGRDWALRNEAELRRFAPRGMTVSDRFD